MDIQNSIQNLTKRVHIPSQIQDSLLSVLPIETRETFQKNVITSLKVMTCPETNTEFLCCDFNEYSNSYRSPFTGKYVPSIKGPEPSKLLRDIEVRANALINDYKDSFYKHGISSAYIKETSERSYSVCFVIKKNTEKGSTDVSHVIELVYDGHHKILFKLVTKLLVTVKSKGFTFQGSISKTHEEGFNRMEDSKLEINHMIRMIEHIEGNLKRYTINFIQSKTLQVSNSCRFFSAKNERIRDIGLIQKIWNERNKGEGEENKLSG